MQEDLASIREIVDLSPQEALDSDQEFLTRQGYGVALRTPTTLTVERQDSGGRAEYERVHIKVSANYREGVQEQQKEWLACSESLPKKVPEEP